MNNSQKLALFEHNRLREDLSNEISNEIDKVQSNWEPLINLTTNLLKKKKMWPLLRENNYCLLIVN